MRIEAFLKQSLPFEVTRTSRNFDRHIARIFQKEELTFLAALALVSIFFEHPKTVTPSQLAETLCTTRGNVSHCISSLEAKGFIHRRIDPDDARSFHLLLRPQGKKHAMQVIRTLDRMQKDFESRLGTAELAAALDIVKRVDEICADIAASISSACTLR
jgi:DNA-binding MarR family transcriptional regulator